MSRLVVVSNRVAIPSGGKTPPGGLAVAVLAALQEHGGLWFGWSGEVTEDRDPEPRVVRRRNVTYTTIDLQTEDHEQYYNGFCNSVLWPLCHYRTQYVDYSRQEWQAYNRVNELFARKLAPLLRADDLIWVHDYHLFSLARKLRDLGIRNRMGFFLHIPFPAWGLWRTLPCYKDLLQHTCEYDLVGFQTADDLLSFHNCVKYGLNLGIRDDNWITSQHHELEADVFPIGIDVQAITSAAEQSRNSSTRKRLARSLKHRKLIIGVDRLDYSKGLLSRFKAFERFLERFPRHNRKCVFLQIAPQSRKDAEGYAEIRRELEESAGHINGRFADFDWVPVRYLNQGFGRDVLVGFLHTARVGLVTPLRDGMNLVAKEYVAAQDPEDPGVLVLSRLAGAARELYEGAIMVNPFDMDAVAEALDAALNTPLDERVQRWRTMMEVLRNNDICAWRNAFVKRLEGCGRQA